ncbi:MAG: DUF1624 domain-containing protein [Deltaproteobacteria bacterium]|nr:DUF1624 domain-containing protein [Deltaproteobacteria bacterium]
MGPKEFGERKDIEKPDNRSAHKRILSIDLIRGFSIVGMVLVHFGIYFGNEDAGRNFAIIFLDHCLADWGAAVFLMTMGMSQVLSARRMEKPDNWLLFKRALVRGTYIFGVGLLMLVLAWGPGQIWWWDILTLMGVGTIVLFFCRFLPSWILIAMIGAIMVLTPWLRGALDIAADWEFVANPVISQYLPGMYIEPTVEYHPAILKGLLLSGYFPVFPWIVFTIIGFVMGRRIVAQKMRRDLPFLFLAGALLLCLGFALAYAGRTRPLISVSTAWISPFCFYPDSFSLINIQAGMSIIFFGTVYFFFDVRKKDPSKPGIMGRLFIQTSNFSLTFYFLHYMLIGWPLAILYLYTGKYMVGDLMGAAPALLCGLGAVVLLEILIFFWGKAASKYSLEWFLARLTKLVVPGYKRSISSARVSSERANP